MHDVLKKLFDNADAFEAIRKIGRWIFRICHG